MKNSFVWVTAMLLLFTSCTKTAEILGENGNSSPAPGESIKYTIKKGQHYSDKTSYKAIETSELKFSVKFDSSAIYQTIAADNQDDINKLYGFSDNSKNHHEYSARFGWRWSNNKLSLFAYVYNAGVVESKELATVAIGDEINCSIKVTNNQYIFAVNHTTESLPRLSTTPKAKGYMLYPYFGGDEVAPHDVDVWVKNL